MKSQTFSTWLLLCYGAVFCSAALGADKAPPATGNEYRNGDKLAGASPAASAAATTAFRQATWDDLVPKNWNPMKGIDTSSLGRMRDGDPRTTAMLDKLKKAWDNAPTVPAMDQARIRIPGFVVPLETEGGTLREFLLVPYYGACIHSPPPPANQIIHVKLANPATDVQMMDAIWVSGTLQTAISDTDMGTAGYRMEGQIVEPYQAKR